MYLQLTDITKMYDESNGVKNINLNVNKGEFITLLGPSGCGKSTILNMIGGFLKADSGNVILDGENIGGLSPEKRPISTVFQSYALFPHMTVEDNVGYGIRFSKKISKKEARKVAQKYLEIVGLLGYSKSKIGKLSGGQQQRVALARAMATNPKILLLDEPLSNLDASLRVKMRYELKELQNKLGITMIFVTHDQEEALCLSDKIAVMDKGKIVQVGSPQDIYFTPKDQYVSSFIGKSNLLKIGMETYVVRPEDILIMLDHNGEYEIIEKVFMGAFTEYKIFNGSQILFVRMTGRKNNNFELKQNVNIEIQFKTHI